MSKRDYSCEHSSSKYKCKICYPQAFCEHDKRKDVCKLCSGCEHGNIRYYCKDCKGGGICEHFLQRSLCKKCGDGTLANFTKRITKDDEKTLVGTDDIYEAVCRKHFH